MTEVRPSICWPYKVIFHPKDTGCTAEGTVAGMIEAVLNYYPATMCAIIKKDDEELDCQSPISAMELSPGNFISFSKGQVEILPSLESPNRSSTIKPTTSKDPLTDALVEKYAMLWTDDCKRGRSKTWNDGMVEFHREKSLAIFFNEEGKILYRKKYAPESYPRDGEIIETAKLIIEISTPLFKANVQSTDKTQQPTVQKQKDQAIANVKPADNITQLYELLYTTDKVRKSKRWKDGLLRWNPSNNDGVFLDETGKELHRRKLSSVEMQEGSEITTGMYIFQIGPSKEAEATNRNPTTLENQENVVPIKRKASSNMAFASKTTKTNASSTTINQSINRGRSTLELISLLKNGSSPP